MLSDYFFIQLQIIKIQSKIDQLTSDYPLGPENDGQYNDFVNLMDDLEYFKQLLNEV